MVFETSPKNWPPSVAAGVGLVGDRVADCNIPQLPEGTMLVSADSHIILSEDIWKGNVPSHVADRMPTIYWDDRLGFFQTEVNGQPIFPEDQAAFWNSMDKMPGARSSELEAHLADITAEGVQKEVVAPQTAALFFKWPDYEVREWVFRIYNRYMAGLQRKAPDRFFPVAVGNYWDPAQSADWVREIDSLGMKAVMLPFDPGVREDGSKIGYSEPVFEEMWSEIEARGLVAYFHIGENANPDPGPNGFATNVLKAVHCPFRAALGALIFGRVFDKFPKLKVVFAEAGIYWVPGFLQDAELIYDVHCDLVESRPDHRPSHYWHTNCWASFMTDKVGLSQLDITGADRVMWSHDYPHSEGTFGFISKAIQQVLDAVPPEQARMILGGTAIEVFNLN